MDDVLDPLFKEMSTTPFSPLAPYMADDDASFNIVISAISPGFKKSNGLLVIELPIPVTAFGGSGDVASIGTPSTTYNGLLPLIMELFPRIFVIVVPPG